jgi:DNA-binding NtrC family response regulator
MNKDSGTRHERILIIDDNCGIHDDFRKIFISGSASESALSKADAVLFDQPLDETGTREFQIDSAYQGEEGLALVQRAQEENRPYSLAFVDVRMPPGLDGIETTSRIWKIEPEMQIVICTAFSDYPWNKMLARLPRSDQLLILKKPFDTIEVLQLGHSLTKKWRLQKAAKFNLEFLQRNVDTRNQALVAENAKLQSEIKRLAESLRESEMRFQQSSGKN